ncbi:Voltage-gated ion channel, partial [Globisporangium splendens]
MSFSSPLTRSALRKISASSHSESFRQPLATQKQQKQRLAVATGAAVKRDQDEAGGEETGATAAGGHNKRASIERERIIQVRMHMYAKVVEYAAYQSILTPVKRRRASRKTSSPIASTPESAKRKTSIRPSASTTSISSEPAAAIQLMPPSATKKANVVPVDEKAAAKDASSKSEEILSTVLTPLSSSTSMAVPSSPCAAVAKLSSEEKHLDGAPEGELFLVNVLSRDDFQPSTDVNKESHQLGELLKRKAQSTDESAVTESDVSWGKEYYAVDSIRRFAIHHPEQLKLHIDKALPSLVCPAVSSLRSAMTRNALLCIQDIIICLKDDASSYFGKHEVSTDTTIPLLLNRTSSEKQFIRDLAREIGLYVHKCIIRLDRAVFEEFVLEKHPSFIAEMTALLNCKVVECKVTTRKSLQYTRKAVGESNFVALVKSKLTGSPQFDVLKASEDKKPAKEAAPKLSMRDRMMQMRKQQMGKQQRAGDSDDVVHRRLSKIQQMKKRKQSTSSVENGSFASRNGFSEPALWNAFDPHSKFIKVWHLVLFCCLIYEAFLLPYAVTFISSLGASLPKTREFQLFYTMVVLFCVDFYVKLNTGYYEDGNIHLDTRKSRLKYVKSLGFVLDVLAVVPLSLVPMAQPRSMTHESWLETHKVLRMWRIPKYFSNLEDVYSKNFILLKLLKVLLGIAFVAHATACTRFSFAWDTDGQDIWFPPSTFGRKSLHSQYLISLFWSCGLLAGAFGGELPHYNEEFLFTILVAMIGFALFTYLCATLFVLSKSESSQTVIAQARINQLKHLLSFHHVPDALQAQAVEFIKRHYTDAESNDREVVKLLCPSISKDIQVELLKGMMSRIPLFKECNEQFIIALTSLLEMISLPAHHTLFNTGDAGDCMYVVNSGVLHILVNGVKVRELRKGSFFGEVSVFSKRPRSATVVTTSYCTLYRLSRFHTERVLEGYPHYADLISKTVDEIVNQRQNGGAGDKNDAEDFMLTTLYQLSTEPPNKRRTLKKRRSIGESMKLSKKKPTFGRSKSSQNVSAVRHTEFSVTRISVNEKRELNTSPIVLPQITPHKKATLKRSNSVFTGRLASTVSSLIQRAKPAEVGPSPQDAIRGFYDKLSDRMLQQRNGHAVAPMWSKLLMKKSIDAASPMRQYWLLGLQLHLLFNWVFIPSLLAFPLLDCSTPSLVILHVAADLLLLVDLYLNCHLTFTADDHEKVTQPVKTALHYFRRAFAFDLLCLLPYEVLLLGVDLPRPEILRIPRLLRAWHAHGHLREWTLSFRLCNIGKLVVTIVLFSLFLHLVTCFGIMSASYSGEMPKSSVQCVFTVVTLLCGFFLFAFIVGNLSDVVDLMDADTRDFNAKLSSLRHMLAHF